MSDGKLVITVDLDGTSAQDGVKRLKDLLGQTASEAEKGGSAFKDFLGASLVSNAILSSLGMLKNGVSEIVGELNSSSKAWQTFNANMGMLGKSQGEIDAVRGKLQKFAQDTIYSASDMAQTYSQLAAVGIGSTDKLVMGFGGLAAAAENPTQAMKTLSTQAVQMAAKPTVAWADVKLMLEQTPAGIAAVAKHMGMSTAEMVTAVQDGKIATEDFFNAIQEVGTNADFTNLATQYKTVDQAVDGLKETLTNKLQPAFDVVSKYGIQAIEALIGFMDQIPFDKLAGWIDTAIQSILSFNDSIGGMGPTIAGVIGAVAGLFGAFKSLSMVKGLFSGFKIPNPFTSLGKMASEAVNSVTSAFKGVATGISTVFKGIGKTVSTAFQGIMRGISMLNPVGVASFALGVAAVTAALVALSAASGMVLPFLQGLANIFVSVLTGAINAFAGALLIISPILPIIAQSLAMLSPLIVAVGTAIGATAPAIQALGTAIQGIIQVIGTALPPIIATLGTAINQIVATLGTALAEIATAITPIVDILANAFVQIVQIVSQAIVQIVQALAPFIPSITEMVQALAPVLLGIVDAFNNVVSQIAPIIAEITNLVQQLGDSISQVFESIGGVIESIGKSIKSVLDGLAGVFDSIGNSALNAGKGFKYLAQGVVALTNTKLGDLVASLGATATGVAAIAAAASGLGNAGTQMKNLAVALQMMQTNAIPAVASLNLIASSLPQIVASLSSISPALTTVGASFLTFGNSIQTSTSGMRAVSVVIITLGASLTRLQAVLSSSGASANVFSSGISRSSSSLDTFQARATETVASVTTLTASVRGLTPALATVSPAVSTAVGQFNNFKKAETVVISVMKSIATSIRTQGAIMAQNGSRAGRETATNIATGIRSGQGPSVSAMQSLIQAVSNVAHSGAGTMRYVGAMIGQGLAQGMLSALGAVTAAANALIAQAERAAKAKAKIRSPSRLFRDSIGRYIPAGVAVGIDKNTYKVENALDDMYGKISRFTSGAESVIGIGKTKLSKAVHSTSKYEQSVNEQVKVVEAKKDETFNRMADIAEKALERPVEMRMDDDTLVARTAKKMTKAQQEQQRLINRTKGID